MFRIFYAQTKERVSLYVMPLWLKIFPSKNDISVCNYSIPYMNKNNIRTYSCLQSSYPYCINCCKYKQRLLE